MFFLSFCLKSFPLFVVASCPLKDIAHLFTFLPFYFFTFQRSPLLFYFFTLLLLNTSPNSLTPYLLKYVLFVFLSQNFCLSVLINLSFRRNRLPFTS